ncbi:MAG: chromosomal replication initiator protein DnaA [Candidatus Liptonbacteria bacterium]|nr:chromosomal replication initiator protein DnaA [Candidatus Liptonbacteria bacterium]
MENLEQQELTKIWQSILNEIELQLPKASFVTWLKNSELVDKKDGVAYIALPNSFTKAWVENKYNKIILGNIRLLDDSTKNIKYLVKSAKSSDFPKDADKNNGSKTETSEKQLAFPEFKIDPETNLNPKYTFATYVVGGSNELAYAAAQGVVGDIGKKYNPLFIYGGVGLGKTHLMQSVGNEIKNAYKNQVRVKYVSSEKFTSDVIAAIRAKRAEDVKKKYRDVDVLIIDDIQFIAGKEKTEEEFFNTFNALYEVNKQIVISSDRPPKAIPVLEERLRSRFEGGMVVDISPPDYETRTAIIKTKLQQKNKELPDSVIDVIAAKVRKNIREIEGIVNVVLFYKEQKRADLTPQAVEEIIRKNTQHTPENITPNHIVRATANFFQIPIDDLMGKCRRKEFVRPRQVAIYLLRDMLDLSYPHIGDIVGKKDHTTAIHAYEKINKELNKNSDLNQKIILIKDIINKSSE